MPKKNHPKKADDKVERTILPIPDVPHVGLTTYDAKDPDTKYRPIRDLRPPEGAPNVLIILLDDVGFAASSAFGGPCQTPNAEQLAADGLKYNRFHTAAICSATRQALLTGRNHHSCHMGGITEIATAAPGPEMPTPVPRFICPGRGGLEGRSGMPGGNNVASRGSTGSTPSGGMRLLRGYVGS